MGYICNSPLKKQFILSLHCCVMHFFSSIQISVEIEFDLAICCLPVAADLKDYTKFLQER